MSAFVIKLIACIAMLIDHIGFVFEEPLAAVNPGLPLVFRLIGRLAFPLFAFGVAEGAVRTSSPRKYLLRMFIFMLIAQVPFMLMIGTHNAGFAVNLFGQQVNLYKSGSVLVTLFLGLAVCLSLEGGKPLGAALAIAAAFIFDKLVGMDYGFLGVLFVAAIYFSRNTKVGRLIVMILFAACFFISPLTAFFKSLLDGSLTTAGFVNLEYFIGMCVPAVLLLFYNGRQGPKLKYAVYAFYPLHMLVLWVIWAVGNVYKG